MHVFTVQGSGTKNVPPQSFCLISFRHIVVSVFSHIFLVLSYVLVILTNISSNFFVLIMQEIRIDFRKLIC